MINILYSLMLQGEDEQDESTVLHEKTSPVG
jgi:hypothetical protein